MVSAKHPVPPSLSKMQIFGITLSMALSMQPAVPDLACVELWARVPAVTREAKAKGMEPHSLPSVPQSLADGTRSDAKLKHDEKWQMCWDLCLEIVPEPVAVCVTWWVGFSRTMLIDCQRRP